MQNKIDDRLDRKNTGSLAERLQRLKRATSREGNSNRENPNNRHDTKVGNDSPIHSGFQPRSKGVHEIINSTAALIRVETFSLESQCAS